VTDDQFDKLSPQLKTAYLLGVASRLFGRELVQKLYDNTKPLVDDMFGHGPASRPRHPGQAEEEGGEDFWGGVWKIHRAD
jgi:hypothetical protein